MTNPDQIIRLAARGDGVTSDGRFVAFAAPGDIVDAGGGITPGPHHATPPCRHFPKCGGCQLQHIDDAAYGEYLTARIVEGLAAQGVAIPEIAAPHISPPRSRRRASLRAERKARVVTLGFREGKSHALVDLTECHVLHPALFALVKPLRPLLATLLKDRRGGDVRMTLTDQGVDLTLSGVEVEGLAATEALTDFAARHKLARLSVDEGYGASPRYEPEPVTVTLGGAPVGLPEGAFLQATSDGEAALVAEVRRIVSDAATVADLFSGLGTFTFCNAAPVSAFEGARDAIIALQVAANRGRLLVSSEHRDLFRRPLTVAELDQFQAVILDPPRAGAFEQIAQLAASTVPRIAYVSCNPATFARDAKVLMDSGYNLETIKPVGQFRWSTHVELAAAFSR